MIRRNISYDAFDIFCNGILDLSFELIHIKVDQTVKFDKRPVIRDVEGNRTSGSHRNCKIKETRIENIKIWYGKPDLHHSREIDEVDFRLERRGSTKSQTYDARQNRKILRLDGLIVRPFDEIH